MPSQSQLFIMVVKRSAIGLQPFAFDVFAARLVYIPLAVRPAESTHDKALDKTSRSIICLRVPNAHRRPRTPISRPRSRPRHAKSGGHWLVLRATKTSSRFPKASLANDLETPSLLVSNSHNNQAFRQRTEWPPTLDLRYRLLRPKGGS